MHIHLTADVWWRQGTTQIIHSTCEDKGTWVGKDTSTPDAVHAALTCSKTWWFLRSIPLMMTGPLKHYDSSHSNLHGSLPTTVKFVNIKLDIWPGIPWRTPGISFLKPSSGGTHAENPTLYPYVAPGSWCFLIVPGCTKEPHLPVQWYRLLVSKNHEGP